MIYDQLLTGFVFSSSFQGKKVEMRARTMNVEQWAFGRKVYEFFLGTSLAPSADALFAMLNLLHKGRSWQWMGKTPDLDQWLLFYKSHRYFRSELVKVIFGNDSTGKESSRSALQLLDYLHAIPVHLTDAERIEVANTWIQEFKRSSTNQYAKKAKSLRSVFSDLANDFQEDLENKSMIGFVEPVIQFYMKVYIPCLALYRREPWPMLHKALHGDMNCLRDLLKLDKALLGYQRIGEIFHRASWNNPRRFRSLMRAYSGGVKKMNRQQVKNCLGGLIQSMSKPFGGIDGPILKRLFDAIAKDQSDGKKIIDTDLKGEDESITRRFREERHGWNAVFYPDKNRP